MLQTICVTGNGESFSICSSTIERISFKSLLGSWTARKKTLSAGKPRDVEFIAQKRAPIFRNEIGGDRFADGELLFFRERERVAVGVEAPNCRPPGDVWRTFAECQRAIAWAPFTQTSALVSSTSDSRCSSVWVTRSTSSMVVWPALTLFQPSVRKRAHAVFHRLLRDRRGGGAVQESAAESLRSGSAIRKCPCGPGSRVAGIPRNPRRARISPFRFRPPGNRSRAGNRARPFARFCNAANRAHQALRHAPLRPTRPPGTARCPCRSNA